MSKHGEIFTLYLGGNYITFSANAQDHACMYKAKTTELDLNQALVTLFPLLMPKDLKKETSEHGSMRAFKVLTGITLSDDRCASMVKVLPQYIQHQFKAFDWKQQHSTTTTVKDLFGQVYEMLFHLNVNCFMSITDEQFCKTLFPAFHLSFEGSDKLKTLKESLRAKYFPCLNQVRDVDVKLAEFVKLCTPFILKRIHNEEYHDDLMQDMVQYYSKEAGARASSVSNNSDETKAQEEYIIYYTAMTLYGIILGAQSNTYSSLAWTICHLSTSSGDEIRNKLFPCDYSESAKMDLLEDCIRESIRLAKADWILPRMVLQPFTVVRSEGTPAQESATSIVIPKGNILLMRNVLNDEAVVGPNPLSFNPYRYTENEHLFKAVQKHPQLWGAGLHLCKGIKYAILLNKLFLIEYFKTFNATILSSGDELKNTRRPIFGLTLPSNPIQLSLTAKV